MPGPNQPALPGPFIGPPTPFRPVDVFTGLKGEQTSSPPVLGKSWYVRIGGSNNNGGSDTGLAALRTGTDGVLNSTTTFTSATAAFTSADVGRGICINTGAAARHHKIVSVTNGTTVVLDRVAAQTASGLTWAIGGAWADWRAACGDAAANTDTNSPLASGDICYIGAGVYRVLTSFGATWAPTGVGVTFQGDVSGAFTGDAGMVQITQYTTSDKTTPPNTHLVQLNGVSNLAFRNLLFVVGITTTIDAATTASRNVSFSDCTFTGYSNDNQVNILGGGGPSNWRFDRCYWIGEQTSQNVNTILVTLPLNPGADYDCNITVANCVFITGERMLITQSGGTGTGRGGGVRVLNCFFFGPTSGAIQTNGSISLSIPCAIYNSVLMGVGVLLQAATQGQLIENYNIFACNSPRSNVTAGSKSVGAGGITPYAFLFHSGQELQWGGTQRPFGEPMQSSPLRAFGALDTSAGPIDIRGVPRPSSAAAWDVGPYQRGNTAVQTQSVVEAGTSAIQIVGNGSQDFDVPVDATATSLSIYVRYDSNYVGPLPQVGVVKGQQVGVGDTPVPVSTASLNAWAQYTIVINPTRAGIVTIRVVSGDVSGVGNVYADAFTVS